jgi:hypothetical protein
MNINKNILLNNGFKFREFDDNSPNNHSGDFELFKFEKYRIYFMLFDNNNTWHLKISNYETNRKFEIRISDSISVEDINTALKLCNINIQLS